jgi:hypothetical protein
VKTKILLPSLILLLFLLIGTSSAQSTHYYLWWDTTYAGSGANQDSAVAMALDNSGNLYVTGWSIGNGPYSDIVTIKYNSITGGIIWTNRYDYNQLTDKPTAIVVDNNSGAVYVTGYSYVALPSNRDFVTIKYDPVTGDTVWTRRYNGLVNGGDESYAIGVDASGNVFIAGNSDHGGTMTADIVTIKYTPSGSPTERTILLPNFQKPNALKLDAAGNVYITGITRTNGNTVVNEDYFTVKYDNSLLFQWSKTYNGTADNRDNATALAIDGSGNVYVTGFSYWMGQYYNYVTIKYASNGDSLAGVSYDGPLHYSEFPTAIALDNSSNVFVTGYSTQTLSPTVMYDYATLKYNSSLEQQWVARYNGTGSGDDKAVAMTVDNLGDVYVTGFSTGTLPYYDYLTIKYSSEGNVDTTLRQNGNAELNDYPAAIALGPSYTIYVTGAAYFTGSGLDYYTLRYSLSPYLNTPKTEQVPDQYNLFQNYPNPFNPATTIKFDIPKSSLVKLSVFDITGKEIEVLANETLNPGSYSVNWDAGKVSSGIYFYRLTAGDFVQTRKMILVK